MVEEQNGYLSIEEVVSIPSVSELAVRRDGLGVAYVKRSPHWDDNTYVDHVWIYDAPNHLHYALTSDNHCSTSPIWSPTSHQLAYLKLVGEGENRKPQIFVTSDSSACGVQVTYSPDGVNRFLWAPDGSGFYFSAQIPEPKVLKDRKRLFGEFEYVDTEYRRTTLYYVSLSDGLEKSKAPYTPPSFTPDRSHVSDALAGHESQKCHEKAQGYRIIHRDDLHILDFDVSATDDTIVFTAKPTPSPDDYLSVKMYLFDIARQELSPVDIHRVIGPSVQISPDGTRVAFTYSNDGSFYDNDVLATVSLATGEVTELTSNLDESVHPVSWTDKGVLIEWQNRTNRLIELVSEDGRRTPIVEGQGILAYGSSVTPDGSHIAYIRESTDSIPEVYLTETKVTDNGAVYRNRRQSQKRVIRWTSQDGIEIEGILSTPPEFDPTQAYPLLVVVHGGPVSASFATPTRTKYYPIEQFVEKGFIVLEPNYRGSSGYGFEFRKLNVRNLGIGDYWDVISGVDALIEQGVADKHRVGVMGWSQGGYISAFCSTYSDRFRAISVGAGISNWMTYYVNTDIHPFTRHYLAATPWEDEEVYKRTSPMTYINQANTPTLIQHGDKDSRVPVPNAFELYQGLRDMGVQTQLVLFKGMEHGANKPGLHRAILRQNLAWFSHHILGESLDGFWI